MPYYQYRIDASQLDAAAREVVWNFLLQQSDIHSATPSQPGIYEAFFTKNQLQLLHDPILTKCLIEDITQKIHK